MGGVFISTGGDSRGFSLGLSDWVLPNRCERSSTFLACPVEQPTMYNRGPCILNKCDEAMLLLGLLAFSDHF